MGYKTQVINIFQSIGQSPLQTLDLHATLLNHSIQYHQEYDDDRHPCRISDSNLNWSKVILFRLPDMYSPEMVFCV